MMMMMMIMMMRFPHMIQDPLTDVSITNMMSSLFLGLLVSIILGKASACRLPE